MLPHKPMNEATQALEECIAAVNMGMSRDQTDEMRERLCAQAVKNTLVSLLHNPSLLVLSDTPSKLAQPLAVLDVSAREAAVQDLIALVLKRKVLAIVRAHGQLASERDDKSPGLFAELFVVLDIALCCTEARVGPQSEKFVCDPSLPFTILEDLVDMLTIERAQELFGFLESREGRLTQNMDPAKGKGLVLLRFCNELLRRLSKTKHTETCGRILTFLTMVFPLTERSGVNLNGEYNVENVTNYDTLIASNDNTTDNYDDFYLVFWSLQQFFLNPKLLFLPANFEKFKKGVKATITHFEKLDESTNWSRQTGRNTMSKSNKRKLDDVALNGSKRHQIENSDST
ncbi:hypothetical protein HK096_011400, partial [Nowakowskiella sp. JEL0078]